MRLQRSADDLLHLLHHRQQLLVMDAATIHAQDVMGAISELVSAILPASAPLL